MAPNNKKMHNATKAIHTGGLENTVFVEVSVPISQSSTFSFQMLMMELPALPAKAMDTFTSGWGNQP